MSTPYVISHDLPMRQVHALTVLAFLASQICGLVRNSAEFPLISASSLDLALRAQLPYPTYRSETRAYLETQTVETFPTLLLSVCTSELAGMAGHRFPSTPSISSGSGRECSPMKLNFALPGAPHFDDIKSLWALLFFSLRCMLQLNQTC